MTTPKSPAPHTFKRILPQILIPTLTLLLLSNIAILATTYVVLDRELLATDDRLLISEARTLSNNFQDIIANLVIETRQASGFPAIEGVIQAEKKPDNTQELQEWKARVGQLFVGMLRANPALSQVRLINISGKEVVRAEGRGTESSISVIAENELQDKSGRGYFQAAIKLEDGQSFISDINLNEENGQIIEPRELVVRVARPVFAQSGENTQPYGIIVVNLSMAYPLDRLTSLAGSLRTVRLVDESGSYLYHSGENIAITNSLDVPRNFYSDFPDVEQGIGDNAVYKSDRQRLTVVPLSYGDDLAKHFPLFLAVSSESSDAISLRSTVLRQTSVVLITVMLVAIAICIFITRRITTPLSRMSNSLAKNQQQTLMSHVPSFAPQEIQQLAEAFDLSYKKLAANQHQLKLEIEHKQRAQSGLEEKVTQLNNANNELQQFTYIASHDLQEPLRTIRSFVDLIHKQYSELYDEKGRTMLNFIDEASIRMETLVKDLLDYGRIGAKNSLVSVDLNDIFLSVKQDLTNAIETSNATVTQTQLPVITGRETELRLLFQNLLSNALKFRRSDVAPEINISSKEILTGWQISVCDNGIGVAEEHRHKIFGVFKRLHTKSEYPGTGIGLAHCKKIVELHGGNIWIEPNQSGGSCIVFTIQEIQDEKD